MTIYNVAEPLQLIFLPHGYCSHFLCLLNTLDHNFQGSCIMISIYLTHWGRVTHICVRKITITGSDNGLAPERRQAIIWTSAGTLLIGPLGTNFSEMLIGIQTFSFKKMHSKMLSAKWHPFCLGLNVLILVITGKKLLHNNPPNDHFNHSKMRIVMMQTLLTMVALQVVLMTSCSVTN